ncbi:hypothetical protein N3K66_002121 [Trichothecium roseum]|uniref:Uncharacterized protein n=1 Tax=Trichothecium roseum TaxID=47278 RepID=A0ACC0V8Q1_9HYPO|nr:hypothetical protein N3K66_002121 [Trichothecium roseum]
MTGIASDSAATILCTSKQTRFDIAKPNYKELDIEGLNIIIKAEENRSSSAADSSKTKVKRSKAKTEGIEILSDATLRLKPGQRYALVGRNGTGKSTLLKAIAEKLIPGIPEECRVSILQQTRHGENDDESTEKAGKDLSALQDVVARIIAKDVIEQEIRLLSGGVDASDPYAPVRALRTLKHDRLKKRLFLLDKDARLRSGARGLRARKALVAFEKVVAESEALMRQPAGDMTLEDLQKETQEAADTLADLEAQIAAPRLAEVEVRARSVMTGLGFSEERMGAPAAGLSGGWRMRASLSAVLLRDDMDVLILDEPTNFLDLVGIIWLRRYLEQLCEGDAATTSTSAPTLIVVSHDRDFISLCTDLIILRDQKLTYFHGDLPTYESSRAERVRHLTKMKDAQDKQKAHIEKSIQQNIRAGKANDDQNKLRQAKSRQKRLDDRWGMQVNARGGRFRLNDNAGFFHTSRQDIEIEKTDKTVIIALPEPPELRFPGSLISLEKVGFRYGARSPLTLEDITLSVGMGDRVGILGLNGAGKSTLVRLLAGETRPTVGNMASHPRLRLGYYSQHAVEELQSLGKEDPSLTALSLLSREEAVPDGGSNEEGQLRSLLGQLGLPGRLASDVPLGKLSGGQLTTKQ